MLAVEQGGDRQALHEVIRKHSMVVAEGLSAGASNDLLDRLGADPAFARVPSTALRAELEPLRYTGRSVQQVREFTSEYLPTLLARARTLASDATVAEVRV